MEQKINLYQKIELINELISEGSKKNFYDMLKRFSFKEWSITIILISQLLFVVLNGSFTIITINNVFLSMVFIIILIFNVFSLINSINIYFKSESRIQHREEIRNKVREIIGDFDDVFDSDFFKFIQFLIKEEDNRVKMEKEDKKFYLGVSSTVIAFIFSRTQINLDIKLALFLVLFFSIILILISCLVEFIREIKNPYYNKLNRVYNYIKFNIK